jgi:hypothetical protein
MLIKQWVKEKEREEKGIEHTKALTSSCLAAEQRE